MISIFLEPDQRALVETAAREAFPRECCGLLEGRRDGTTVCVVAVHPMRNIAPEACRFEIDPAEHVALLRATRGRGNAIVGCYHSHPKGRAEPSEHDRTGAGETGFVWLIAAVDDCKDVLLRSFVFTGNDFVAASLDSPTDARV
jgi:proteasome lid subunit RPN8/RPN11